MFTVIIPTMWRGEQLSQMLKPVHDHPLVGEILLINNQRDQTPDWYANGDWNKINQYAPESNIGVNPAWNIGVENARFDKILLLSDDVLFTTSLLDYMHPLITEEVGCFGPYVVNTPAKGPYTIEPCLRIRGQYGCCLFIHKSNYKPIPKEFLIYYGDNYIHMACNNSKKPCYFIMNANISTPVMATSSLSVFKKQAETEHKTWKRIYKDQWTTEP